MEKSGPPVNYPSMPAEMQEASHSGFVNQQPAAPPSYDQATHTTPYPPVQVLPTPSGTAAANVGSQMPQQQYNYIKLTNGANAQHTYGSNTQYGAGNMEGGIPPPHHTYTTNAPGTAQTTGQPPVVIIQQHAILPLGPEPTNVTCPACHITKLTRIDHEPSARTHLMAAILCLVGLWCCVCVPYCSDSCMGTNHYCGNCNKFLGAYNGGGF